MYDYFTAKVITIYCIRENFLRGRGHKGDPQDLMTTATVMTMALVAAEPGGNQGRSRPFLGIRLY